MLAGRRRNPRLAVSACVSERYAILGTFPAGCASATSAAARRARAIATVSRVSLTVSRGPWPARVGLRQSRVQDFLADVPPIAEQQAAEGPSTYCRNPEGSHAEGGGWGPAARRVGRASREVLTKARG